MNMKQPASIVIDRLSKRYPGADYLALKNLSLEVFPGEVYGFLGPNGAGKSTTIRILLNFLQPSGGQAHILGKDVVKDSVDIRKSVGYLSGDFAVYPKMTGRQYLSYLDQLQGDGNMPYAKKLASEFQADLNAKMGNLSRGNRQKIGLIQAFMHKPQILILDEPTSGLDPLMQEKFYDLILESKQRGASVFTSSHILSEVQKMCDRVGIIREGILIAERVIADMVKEAAQTFDLTFAGAVPTGKLKAVKGLKIQRSQGSQATIHLHGDLKDLFKVLAGCDVTKIDARNLDLEELFIHFYNSKGGKK